MWKLAIVPLGCENIFSPIVFLAGANRKFKSHVPRCTRTIVIVRSLLLCTAHHKNISVIGSNQLVTF